MNLQASHTTTPPFGPRTRTMPLTPDFVEELMAVQRALLPSWKACQMESRIETYFFMFSSAVPLDRTAEENIKK